MGSKKIRGIHLPGRRLSRRANPRLAWKGRADPCTHEQGGARLGARPSGAHAPAWLKRPRGPLPIAPPMDTVHCHAFPCAHWRNLYMTDSFMHRIRCWIMGSDILLTCQPTKEQVKEPNTHYMRAWEERDDHCSWLYWTVLGLGGSRNSIVT